MKSWGAVADEWGWMSSVGDAGPVVCQSCLCVEDPDHPADRLPASLARPWFGVAQQLGRPPVLSYASYALHNWRRLDPKSPLSSAISCCCRTSSADLDEEWFVLIHIDIEAKAGPGLQAAAGASRGVGRSRGCRVGGIGNACDGTGSHARETLLRMPERCDPHLLQSCASVHSRLEEQSGAAEWAHLCEEWLSMPGSRNSSAGETGSQSSIVPALDAGLACPMPRIH